MKVEFAPLNVPLRRRLQTAAALQWVFSFLALAQCCLAAFVLLALSDWWMLALLYAGWLWLDWDTPTCGGRRSQWVRSWSVWDYFRDYFPLRLIKSVDLDPKKNYIFGFHPHGVLVAGAFGNFCTEATGFSRLFPGLRSHLLMLPFWFRVPVFRDYIMCGGSAEKTSIQKVVIKSFISSQREVVMQSIAQLRRETVVHRLQAVPCLHITPEPRPEVRGFLRVGSIPYLFNHFNGCATPEYLITVPICAELLGLVSSCKSSLSHLVSRPAGGNVAVIAVGGAPEALDARPGALTLQVRNRKGFIKLALKHGAHLVPVFSFGENELFDQVENPSGSPLRKLQNRLQSIMGVAMPLFHARGVFQYSFGLMPYRKPIHTVVGKPISVVQTPSPSCEDIECLHKLYMQNLTELFEQHKHNYGLDKQQHLTFI